MKRARSKPKSGAEALDLVSDILSRAEPAPRTTSGVRVGDMTLRKKVEPDKTIPVSSPTPTSPHGPTASPSPSPKPITRASNLKNARRLLEEQLKTGNAIMASMSIQKMPEKKKPESTASKRKKAKYVRSKVPGVDIEEVEEASSGGGGDKKNASYYKYKLPLRPCAMEFQAQMTMDGDDDAEQEKPRSKLEEKERCFVCNWSQFTGSGAFADKIREFFDVYKRAKRMSNFAVTCNALSKWYMDTVYSEAAGMHPMTGRMFFNCMRGAHEETYEVWLRNEIELLKSFNEELRRKMKMGNGSVHPDNYRARAANTKMIDALYGKLDKLLKEEDSGGSGSSGRIGGVSGVPFSFAGIQTKGTQSQSRQVNARKSKIKDMPRTF